MSLEDEDGQAALRRARRWLVVSIVTSGIAIGTYRFARSIDGELGWGGLIFLFPIFGGAALGIAAGIASLLAFWDYVMTAPPAEKPQPHSPDPDAVKQLIEHGALPDRPRTSLVPPKNGVLGLVACLAAGALWLTDPPSMVRQFAVTPLALYGAWQLGRLLWTTARDRL